MDNKLDDLLKEISLETPTVNPYLGNKIYDKALVSKSKKTPFFFKKSLILTLTTLVIICIFVFIFTKDAFKNLHLNDEGKNDPEIKNPFIPNLSPTEQDSIFIDYHYTIYNNDYDVVTLLFNNQINYQKIYIKAYNLSIDDLKINNGDVTINQFIFQNEEFFELVFNNKNSKVHYLDICFGKNILKNILSSNIDYVFQFIMYIGEVDAEKGYGYDFKVQDVYDLREGNLI